MNDFMIIMRQFHDIFMTNTSDCNLLKLFQYTIHLFFKEMNKNFSAL